MNTKKKHKNRPKPTTQKEGEVKLDEKSEDLVPKSDTEISVAKAEATPAIESVQESETPKKPKRNKGKKKNEDKEILEDTIKEKVQEVIQIESDKIEGVVGVEDQDVKKSSDAAFVIPSARKKKNKKKTQEQAKPEVEPECLLKSVEVISEDILKVEAEIKEYPEKVEDIQFEQKSKKKNKKKKRNDSERSDRSEEVVTCTSAFQQFLNEDNKPTVEETEIKATEIQFEETLPENSVIAMPAPDNLIENVSKTFNVTEETKECAVVKSDIVEALKEDNKNKKKNKKDKKHAHEEQKEKVSADIEETLFEDKLNWELMQPIKEDKIEKEASSIVEDRQNLEFREPIKEDKIKKEAIPFIEVKQDLEFSEPIKEDKIEKEASTKPKAKIVKPVEIKQKVKEDPEKEILPVNAEELSVMKKDTLAPKTQLIPHEEVETKIEFEEKSEDVKGFIESKPTPHFVDTMDVPETKTKDKKRKKSPKPSSKPEPKTETKDGAFQEVPLLKIDNIQAETKCEISKGKETAIGGVENVIFTMSEEPFIPLHKSEKTDELPPLLKIEEPFSDCKTGKKKKKTAKTPTTSEVAETNEANQLVTSEVKENKIIPEVAQPMVAESLATPMSDVEIQSVKTDESEGSSCDATPDVHFVRALSQQLIDDNNNTVIREVRNFDETKSNYPLTKMPLLKGSVETPITTPDVVSTGIQMTEGKTENQEPTYLKSKIMEVNQDMEELRLSIERSLAEFTTMEKNEEKAENEYEQHRVECEKTFADDGKSGLKTPDETIVPQVQMSLPVDLEIKVTEPLNIEEAKLIDAPPVCPARKDNKGKSKSKKKGKEATATNTTSQAQSETTSSDSKDKTKEKQDKSEEKNESTDNKGKQQADATEQETTDTQMSGDSIKLSEQPFADSLEQLDFAPIENFEDALTSSNDDVNRTFEIIALDAANETQKSLAANKPDINITSPVEDTDKNDEKINPVSQPKNFLGHNDIPAQSNKTDYKKEKNKTPNERHARVKIKDEIDIEAQKLSKESQTEKRTKKPIDKSEKETFTRVKNDNDEYVYKYSFRKVFLQSACQVCHKDLVQTRVPCGICSLVFYCSAKHKDEDWPQHQALCFAISTIAHLKDQKHIYADAQNVTGQEYRLLRMQMIVSCEKVLKRRLVPWEQEAMLYPRVCGDPSCRQWGQAKLKDCEGCGQISYCSSQPSHLPKSHQRWCKSYMLYSKLVSYQQTSGRLEPTLPTKLMEDCRLQEKLNEVLAAMYEEKIDMNDIQYAALTQLATAPLTAAYCYQLCRNKMNINPLLKKSFTLHVVGAELQFEADALSKWEVFFLHLRPDVEELRVVLISPVLNPGDLPLDLLGKISLCDNCRNNKRRVVFSFQDKKTYAEYRSSEDFVSPDIVCAFNPSIQRSSIFNGRDQWPASINCILKQKIPFIITGYTLTELRQDLARVKAYSEVDFKVISEPVFNNFASVRPDRNFISDDEMPLLFKNYCVTVLFGC